MKPELMTPVLYRSSSFAYIVLGALVTQRIDEATVSLTVFNKNGSTFGLTKVPYDKTGEAGGSWRYFEDAGIPTPKEIVPDVL